MHSLLKYASLPEILRNEAFPFLTSALVAELFFKFHSFSLECLGFLSLWWAIGWLMAAVRGRRTAVGV